LIYLFIADYFPAYPEDRAYRRRSDTTTTTTTTTTDPRCAALHCTDLHCTALHCSTCVRASTLLWPIDASFARFLGGLLTEISDILRLLRLRLLLEQTHPPAPCVIIIAWRALEHTRPILFLSRV